MDNEQLKLTVIESGCTVSGKTIILVEDTNDIMKVEDRLSSANGQRWIIKEKQSLFSKKQPTHPLSGKPVFVLSLYSEVNNTRPAAGDILLLEK